CKVELVWLPPDEGGVAVSTRGGLIQMEDYVYCLVKDSKSYCNIVRRRDGFGMEAEEELRDAIRKSSGVTIGTIDEADSHMTPTDDCLLIQFMQSNEVEAAGLAGIPLSTEPYRAVTRESTLMLCADAGPALTYAERHF